MKSFMLFPVPLPTTTRYQVNLKSKKSCGTRYGMSLREELYFVAVLKVILKSNSMDLFLAMPIQS